MISVNKMSMTKLMRNHKVSFDKSDVLLSTVDK